MKCPNCGHSVFSSDTPTLPTQATGRRLTVWDDVVTTGGIMTITTMGGYVALWQSGIDWYWLAPVGGLVAGLGLAAWKLVLDKPQRKIKRERGLTIDVRQRGHGGQSQQWYFNAFPNVRPSQLWQFANAAINHDCPISRRHMKRYKISEGQYATITNCMVERFWLEVSGDTINAPRTLTRPGMLVLRGVLSSPGLASVGAISGVRHHPTTTPPRGVI